MKNLYSLLILFVFVGFRLWGSEFGDLPTEIQDIIVKFAVEQAEDNQAEDNEDSIHELLSKLELVNGEICNIVKQQKKENSEKIFTQFRVKFREQASRNLDARLPPPDIELFLKELGISVSKLPEEWYSRMSSDCYHVYSNYVCQKLRDMFGGRNAPLPVAKTSNKIICCLFGLYLIGKILWRYTLISDKISYFVRGSKKSHEGAANKKENTN